MEDPMMKTFVMVLAACALVAGCGDDDTTTGPSANEPPIFTAQLSPANEVPPVSNSEATARGAVQVTLDVTRNASNAITAATAGFYFQATGLPAGTPIVGAHIHPGVAGTNGGVIVNTGLSAAAPLTMPSGPVEFTVSGIPVDPAVAQGIINNPGAYYFNIHTPLNPGGVARGQLVQTR
jgi:CHRD domain